MMRGPWTVGEGGVFFDIHCRGRMFTADCRAFRSAATPSAVMGSFSGMCMKMVGGWGCAALTWPLRPNQAGGMAMTWLQTPCPHCNPSFSHNLASLAHHALLSHGWRQACPLCVLNRQMVLQTRAAWLPMHLPLTRSHCSKMRAWERETTPDRQQTANHMQAPSGQCRLSDSW